MKVPITKYYRQLISLDLCQIYVAEMTNGSCQKFLYFYPLVVINGLEVLSL